MGQLFHLFESPNRFGLPAFYTLHVWAWKDNPNGTFTNWNPERLVRRVQPGPSVGPDSESRSSQSSSTTRLLRALELPALRVSGLRPPHRIERAQARRSMRGDDRRRECDSGQEDHHGGEDSWM